jgi:hypothetical protein
MWRTLSDFFQDTWTNPLTDIGRPQNVLRYLAGTPSVGICFGVSDHVNTLVAYSDSDFAACAESRRSTSGVVLMLNGAPIVWFSRKQTIVSTSTTEAEYVAAHDAGREVSWTRDMLEELNVTQSGPTRLHVDNVAAQHLINNPSHHRRTKHIDVKYHYTRSLVETKRVSIVRVESALQLADIFTKALPKPLFHKLRDLLNIH